MRFAVEDRLRQRCRAHVGFNDSGGNGAQTFAHVRTTPRQTVRAHDLAGVADQFTNTQANAVYLKVLPARLRGEFSRELKHVVEHGVASALGSCRDLASQMNAAIGKGQ
ncbi:MAG: hypothetical protein U1F83_11455 [Verrucomicrobiota bacterium]